MQCSFCHTPCSKSHQSNLPTEGNTAILGKALMFSTARMVPGKRIRVRFIRTILYTTMLLKTAHYIGVQIEIIMSSPTINSQHHIGRQVNRGSLEYFSLWYNNLACNTASPFR